jgi:hypothetical protein
MYWLSWLVSGYSKTFCARVCRHHTVGLCDSYCHLVTDFGINWLSRRVCHKHPSQYSEKNFDPEKTFYAIQFDSTNLHQVTYA